jgi:hypothetical protein
VEFFPALGVSEDGAQGDLFAILARKPSD